MQADEERLTGSSREVPRTEKSVGKRTVRSHSGIEPYFSEYSYRFRIGKMAQQAIIKLLEYLNDGYT